MSVSGEKKQDDVTVKSIQKKKDAGVPITMLTAYDFLLARYIDQSDIDMILVGDSLAMVVLGHENTLHVTMDEMLHHCRAVANGASRAMLIGDMPFLSYQICISEAVRNAGRFLKEGYMDAVKLEGGQERLECIRAIVQAGIPVMGHIGLTPQSVHKFGGFTVQAKTAESGKRLLDDAFALQEAGCFSIVLESVPDRLAAYVSQALRIPTIGIGAGAGCDGQVLVTQDLLGMFDRFKPKFVRQYANLKDIFVNAFKEFEQDVVSRSFPAEEHVFHISDEEWSMFYNLVEKNE